MWINSHFVWRGLVVDVLDSWSNSMYQDLLDDDLVSLRSCSLSNVFSKAFYLKSFVPFSISSNFVSQNSINGMREGGCECIALPIVQLTPI
jgi:hypothetical protein